MLAHPYLSFSKLELLPPAHSRSADSRVGDIKPPLQQWTNFVVLTINTPTK
jgi:hypothetical protein